MCELKPLKATGQNVCRVAYIIFASELGVVPFAWTEMWSTSDFPHKDAGTARGSAINPHTIMSHGHE